MKTLKFICAIALLTTMVNAANTVLNHSFNEVLPSPNEWAPADWVQKANPAGVSLIGRIFNDSSDAGTNCQYLTVPATPGIASAGNTNAQLQQSILTIIPAGVTTVDWTASYKILSSPAPSGAAMIQLRAWSAANAFLGQTQFFPDSTGTLDTWITPAVNTWDLPAGTDHLDVLADMGTWTWSAFSGTMYVDNFNIDFIPEPTFILGGLILGLAFLRRK